MRYVFIAILLFASVAAAHTVTMNLALNVGGINNSIRVNDTTYSGNTANSSVMLLVHLDNSTSDSGQYGNNGVISGANCTGVTGRVNGACSFDGISGVVNITASSSLNIIGNVTMAAWVKWTGTIGSGGYAILGRLTEGHYLQIRKDSGTGSKIAVWFSAPVSVWKESNTDVTSDTWHHIAFTYNGTNAVFYLDGAADGSPAVTGTLTGGTTKNLYIGNIESTSRYFNGTIDEVVVWNRSLSAGEVYNLYTYGLSEPVSLTFTSMSKKYISSSQGNTTAALVPAGTLLNARVNNTYNSTHYLFQATQDSTDNRFLFAVTNGSYTNVEDRLSMVDAFRMVSSTFGNFIATAPTVFPLFIRLEYTNIDIDNRADWSGVGQLRIRNNGVTSRNLPNLTLEVVR
ncbi:MAG: LamG domain-containing protein [Candidatus Aenigmatarchaeota archaeon]